MSKDSLVIIIIEADEPLYYDIVMLQYGPVFLTGVCILISWKALLMILFI
jgi:hypothetical protein